MTSRRILTMALLLGSAALSCKSEGTSGSVIPVAPSCPEGQTCTDPNGMPTLDDPFNIPPGSGTVVIDGTATPYQTGMNGSSAVKVDTTTNAVVIDQASFGKGLGDYVWVANSAEGTESKIDTKTMKEVARYCTYPGCNGDPSRSTVSLLGDVVVANRANYFGINAPARASAVKIAGDKSRCVDRNKNGQIDTFEGAGPIPAAFRWPAGVADSPDECVLWLTQLDKDRNGNTPGGGGTLPRAAAFDSTIADDGTPSPFVYIGLFNPNEVVRLDSKTGRILKQFLVNVRPYGFVVDKDGTLWIQGSGTLAKVDVKNNDAVTNLGGLPCAYGISADARGYIYSSGGNCVARYNPATNTYEQIGAPGFSSGRGLALDDKYTLWVADTGGGLYEFDASKPFGQGMTFVTSRAPRGVSFNSYYLGVSLDSANRPWIVSTGTQDLGAGGAGATGIVYNVDKPNAYTATAVTTGNAPYTYSDMSGAQLRYAGARFGLYRHTFQSTCPAGQKTTWTQVTYDIDTPVGTTVEIRARGAGDPQALDSALFGPTTAIPPAVVGPFVPNMNEGANNTLLQLQFKLTAQNPQITPSVKNLKANFLCG